MEPYKDADNLRLAEWLPAVVDWPVERTSEAEGFYNCFAYVADDINQIWAPLAYPVKGIYWPTEVKRGEEGSVEVFFKAYESVGFEKCANGDFEDGVEKIVIYVDGLDTPTHAAIQREGGVWQSKLGPEIDVVHALESLASHERFEWKGYGYPKYFMSRKRSLRPVQR